MTDIAIIQKSNHRTLMNWFGLPGAIEKAVSLATILGTAIIVVRGGETVFDTDDRA